MAFLVQAKTTRPSMGLETEGQCLFEGAITTVVPAVVQNKIVHGLKGDDIKVVEKYYGKSLDKDVDFYASLTLQVPHTLTPLNIKSGEDILRLGVLAAQGKLAPSVQEQSDPNQNYQFVVHDDDAVAEVNASIYTKRAKATAKLVEIHEKEPGYLLALCHFICNFNSGVKKPDAAFLKLGEYIDGKLTSNKSEAVDYFMRILDPVYGGSTPREDIIVRVEFERAKALHIIRFDSGRGCFYNSAIPGSDYGKTVEEVVAFLQAATNSDHLGGGAKDQEYAVRYQIAKKEKTL